MKHKKFHIIMLLLLLIILGVSRLYAYSINSLHRHISISDVESVEIWGSSIQGNGKIATAEETKNIVNWFNSISDIRKNDDFQGTTEGSGITILLKSKNKISIGRSGWNFEVQRYNKNGKLISCWGKQPDIERILGDK